MWVAAVGARLTPTPSVGSSLSCQLQAAGLHAAAAVNSSSKRSSTNFSTSSDNPEDVNCTSFDVGYVSAVDVTQRRAQLSPAADCRQLFVQPPTTSADDVVDAFPAGSARRLGRSVDSDCQRRVDQLPPEVDARTRSTSDHVTRSTSATTNGDSNGAVSKTIMSGSSMPPRRSRNANDVTNLSSMPPQWSYNATDVILSSLSQRNNVDRGIITSTP